MYKNIKKAFAKNVLVNLKMRDRQYQVPLETEITIK